MPTNRKRTPRGRKVSTLNQGAINWLYDRQEPLENPWHDWFFMTKAEIEALWAGNRDEVLTWWIENKPCTRPGPWWKYDAQLEDTHTRVWGITKERRRDRTGGIGTPEYECLGIMQHFILGIPDTWVDQWQADYYNGRALDIHGNPIGTEYKEGHFKGLAIDPKDPPLYESQATYLLRHGILTPAERAHLKRYPALLEPEAVKRTEPE